MRTCGPVAVALALAGSGSTARAQEPDPAASPEEAPPGFSPSLDIALGAEVEYVDVEGPGGFAHRDTARIAPRRRAPYVDLDKATVDFRAHLRPWLDARVELRAATTEARADRLYFTLTPEIIEPLSLAIEVGRQRPMQRPPDRRVETYSPTGLVLWRGREWHAGVDARLALGPVTLRLVPSIAMLRELADESMGEDPNLPTTAFGASDVGEDSEPELGGLLGASAFGASLEGFAFASRLLDHDGPERLVRTFDAYPLLGDVEARTSYWYGARVAFDRWGAHALAEASWQRLGLLERRGFEIGASYALAFTLAGERMEVEPFVRFGRLTLTNLPEVYDVPESWDRDQWVLALILRPIREVEIRIEHLILDERAGRSTEGKTDVDDDQWVVQLRLETDLWEGPLCVRTDDGRWG